MKLFTTTIGRLRLIALVEGFSLVLLVFIALPLKYGLCYDKLRTILGPFHGAAFLMFVFSTFRVGIEEGWKFRETTWKILLACMIPFGTLYIDRKVLKSIYEQQTDKSGFNGNKNSS